MILFKICPDCLCVSTECSRQADTLEDMLRCFLDASSNEPVEKISFGACYEHVSGGIGWQRITYVIGTNREGTSRTLGICDVRPDDSGKAIYMRIRH